MNSPEKLTNLYYMEKNVSYDMNAKCFGLHCSILPKFFEDDVHKGFCYFGGNEQDRYPFRQLEFEFIQVARREIDHLVYNDSIFVT